MKLYPGHRHEWSRLDPTGFPMPPGLVICTVCDFEAPRNVAGRDGRMAEPQTCQRAVGSRPWWMSPDQWDPCLCTLQPAHDGECECEHTIPQAEQETRAEPTNQPEAEYESVRILRLQPGDTIVVRVNRHYLTASQAADIKDHMRSLHPGYEVLVLGSDADLEILRDGDDA